MTQVKQSYTMLESLLAQHRIPPEKKESHQDPDSPHDYAPFVSPKPERDETQQAPRSPQGHEPYVPAVISNPPPLCQQKNFHHPDRVRPQVPRSPPPEYKKSSPTSWQNKRYSRPPVPKNWPNQRDSSRYSRRRSHSIDRPRRRSDSREQDRARGNRDSRHTERRARRQEPTSSILPILARLKGHIHQERSRPLMYKLRDEDKEERYCFYCSDYSHYSKECDKTQEKYKYVRLYLAQLLGTSPMNLDNEIYTFLYYLKGGVPQ